MFRDWSWLAAFSLLALAIQMSCSAWAADDGIAAPSPAAAPVKANFDLVKIRSGSLIIYGILWKPKGNGPFPAVVYNHGSEQKVANKGMGVVGSFYMKNGFVCLLPLRRGHSYSANLQVQCTSEGVFFDDRLNRQAGENAPPAKKNRIWIKEQEVDNQDVVAAVEWLKTQPYVDPKKIIMSGISFGGIQTCLAAEKGLGVRAFVPFAPGAMAWQGVSEVHGRLKEVLENAKAPVFLIQAENDYDLGPSNYLGPVLDKKGPPNRHKVYPPFQVERGHAGGHSGFALYGEDVWAADVSAFLQNAVGQSLPKLTN